MGGLEVRAMGMAMRWRSPGPETNKQETPVMAAFVHKVGRSLRKDASEGQGRGQWPGLGPKLGRGEGPWTRAKAKHSVEDRSTDPFFTASMGSSSIELPSMFHALN